MKKRISRDLIIFIILIPIFLWVTFQLSSSMGNRLPSYSIVNKSKMGLSILNETLRSLNYPVGRSLGALTSENEGTVQIAVIGGSFNINEPKVKEWIGRGGTLIYLTNEKFPNIDYEVNPEINGSLSLYKYTMGRLIVANVDNLTNKALMKDTGNAYELFEIIHTYRDNGIYFNEAHLYSSSSSRSLWEAIPTKFKYIVYQIIMVLAAYIYYKGKGFGKPIPFYEEVERTENEYLYSAAALYRGAGAWDLMLDNYYKNFLKVINCSDEDWLEYWEMEKLPALDKAKGVYDFINNRKTKVKAKEYIQVVSTLEKLNKIFEKRREAYWKTLKKTK
ncbi:MAG: hypothetical protein K0R09_140 [Clostridiales bacterium]|nr:hypothetical protein [Clostridiales bacterium]